MDGSVERALGEAFLCAGGVARQARAASIADNPPSQLSAKQARPIITKTLVSETTQAWMVAAVTEQGLDHFAPLIHIGDHAAS
jgi:hypothetical protein